jgi:hypothetical protein
MLTCIDELRWNSFCSITAQLLNTVMLLDISWNDWGGILRFCGGKFPHNWSGENTGWSRIASWRPLYTPIEYTQAHYEPLKELQPRVCLFNC